MRDPDPASLPTAGPPPVLVVDDEETVRNLLALMVARAGGTADTVENVAQARAALAERWYRAVIVDKNLPDGNGLTVLAHVRETAPRTEVLVVTGYANMESAIEALRLGAFDYVVKPFDVAAVTHRIRLALERGRMQDDLERALAETKKQSASLAESREEVGRAYLETVMRLSRAAEYKDDAAGDHIARISRYAAILARAVDATDTFVETISLAAALHDIGKIGVSDGILRKAGPLTPSERKAVQEHVAIGARILEGATADVLVLAREVVLTHHERWDGGGYPRGLRETEIPLSGRIVALCDAWDAVSTDRVYRRAMSFERALEEIERGAGTAFDPALVEAFRDRLEQIKAVQRPLLGADVA
jgi:putative two-component system response regulator